MEVLHSETSEGRRQPMLTRIYSQKPLHRDSLFLQHEGELAAKVYEYDHELAGAFSMVDDLVDFLEFAADRANSDEIHAQANLLLQQLLFLNELCQKRRQR